MTQRTRVLQMLREAGDRGVHTFELRQAYIGNPSQRISELEAVGFTITHVRERLHGSAVGTRYRLIDVMSGARAQTAGRPEQGVAVDAGVAPALALDIPNSPQCAILGADWDDAA